VNQQEFLLHLYAESPLHAGAADSEGVVDLPIQREVGTRYPVVWGQSLKGALRQAAHDDGWAKAEISELFGPEVGAGTGLEAGRLAVGDAQLVAMPVPTLQRTFAWITTALALERLSRKYQRIGVTGMPEAPRVRPDTAAAVGAPWVGAAREVLGPAVVAVDEQGSADLGAWAKRIADDAVRCPTASMSFTAFAEKFESDLLVVGDDIAGPLLTECTELAVRVSLGSDKTVDDGPFHTEYLPTESVLTASLTVRPSASSASGTDWAARLSALLHGALHQVGGDETIGKGLVWTRLHGTTAAATGGATGADGGGG
jgi:CRISPR-associated protein Cmr4